MGFSKNDIDVSVGFDIQKLTAELSKTNTMFNQWATQIKGSIGMAVSFYAIQAAVSATIKRMAEFQHSMKALEAVTQSSSAELEKLKNNALTMAAAFKANDIAQFELEMAKMGFSTTQVVDMTQAVINLATATGEDLVKSGEFAGATMRQFNMEAKDMTRITDVMQGALNLSSMKLTDFGEAMKYVGPVASQAGMSIEQLASWLVTLSNAGIKGSMLGTATRRIITDLGIAGGVTSENIRKMAHSTLDATQAYDEFGRIAQSAAIVLSNNGDKMEKTEEQLKTMAGVTAAMAKTTQDDMVGAWNRLGGAWDRAIQSGSTLNKIIQSLTDGVADFIDGFTGNRGVADSMTIENAGVTQSYRDMMTEAGKLEKNLNGSSLSAKDGGPLWKIKKNFDELKSSVDGFRASFSLGGGAKITEEKSQGLINDLTEQIKEFKVELGKAPDQTTIDYWLAKIEEAERKLYKLQNHPALKEARRHANGPDQDLLLGHKAIPDSFGKEKTQEEISQQIVDLGKLQSLQITTERSMLRLSLTGQQVLNKIRTAALNMSMDISMALGRAFAGASEDWGAMLLGGLGAMLIELGKVAMETSTLLDAIVAALMNPLGGGAALFIAGAAAVALGSYFVSQSQNMVKNSSTSMSSGGSVRFGSQNVNLTGEFKVKGADLVLVLDKQGYNAGRTGG